uniref:Uncharacterized protein n=1 Tax=Anguilla anguilla TaxID=7936 RepID=A0A0E9XAB6_ANGAN
MRIQNNFLRRLHQSHWTGVSL